MMIIRVLFVVFFLSGITAGASAGNVDLPDYPSISPDGSSVLFSWRGDLWLCSAKGGRAARITSHPGEETRSAWNRQGDLIAFESNRNGARKIYVMNLDGTGIRLVTDIDVTCTLAGFGVDEGGQPVLTFDSSLNGDNYRSPRPFQISLQGGELTPIHKAFGSEPRLSPDGKFCLFTRGGIGWMRRFYHGADQNDVWLYSRADDEFRQLTNWHGKDGKACWAGNEMMYFLSDRNDDRVNVYKQNLSSRKAEQVTFFVDNDIKEFDVSSDGSTAVLAVWDQLYTLDLATKNAQPIALDITANEDETDSVILKEINRSVSESALSPDGKVMAYVAYGEVFVRNMEEKSPTARVTSSHAREKQIAWSPDGLKLYFVSDSGGSDSIYYATVELSRSEIKDEFEHYLNPASEETESATEEISDASGEEKAGDTEDESGSEEDKANGEDEKDKKDDKKELPTDLQTERWHDAIRFGITPLVDEETNDGYPIPSPDGKWLTFQRTRGDVMLLNLETNEMTRLIEGWDMWIDWRWSPDSRYIAYHQNDLNFNSDIWILPVDGSASAVNISRHPDNDSNPRWSADGKILSFLSERVNEEVDVWYVFLDRDLESLTPKERDEYFKKAGEAAKKRKPLPVKNPLEKTDDEKNDGEKKEKIAPEDGLDLDDAYLRLRRVTSLSGSESNLEMTLAGDTLIFNGKSGDSGLYTIQWDGTSLKKIADTASVQHLSRNGEQIVFVKSGRAGTIAVSGGKTEYKDIECKMRIDLEKQAEQKFQELSRTLGDRFYHPTIKGLDWGALSQKYLPLAAKARTGSEFNRVCMYLLGELSGSHLGVYSAGYRASNVESMGRLGTMHTRVTDGYKVLEVIPHSPADQEPMRILPGDVITSIQMETFSDTDTLESRLRGRVGTETVVGVRRTTDEETVDLNLLMTPISWGSERQLKYKDWRRKNLALVEELSKKDIGYIHIQSMDQSSLDVFERDLYAACEGKKGLIIDVRNNGGGWTTDRLLASIMVQEHAYTIPRGADSSVRNAYPQDRLFIQRYTLPINMLCNEKSFSNAEIISHAFKSLQRGTLVGQETHGSVISTGSFNLIDGTTVRLPFRGWYVSPTEKDMENNGAVPDLLIPQTPEAEARGEDEQLKAAVNDLLKRL